MFFVFNELFIFCQLSLIGSQMILLSVIPEGMSGSESFFAEGAGNDDSLKVVRFNMVLDIWALAFFTAYSATMG